MRKNAELWKAAGAAENRAIGAAGFEEAARAYELIGTSHARRLAKMMRILAEARRRDDARGWGWF